jgi:hypothetical protein
LLKLDKACAAELELDIGRPEILRRELTTISPVGYVPHIAGTRWPGGLRMKRLAVGIALVVGTCVASAPASAIPISFFQSYVSGGAMVVRTGNPGDFSRGALLSLNFNPADFSATEAQALYQLLRAALGGGSIESFAPADIAAVGVAPVTVVQTLQQVYLDDFSFSEFYVMNVYRRQPSGLGIDLYLFFAPNDFRYAVTLQF